MSLWTLSADVDEIKIDEESSLGIGAYCKQLDDRATHAKVANAQTMTTVTTTGGWIVMVNEAIAEQDWNPRTVEVEIDGRWIPAIEA